MFNYFFNEYKEKIYPIKYKRYTKPSLLEIFNLVFVIILAISILIVWWPYSTSQPIIPIILFAILFLDIIIYSIITNKNLKKINLENAKIYKKNGIENLKELCKQNVFQLYNENGINLLIKICNDKLNENSLFGSLYKPTLTIANKIIYPVLSFVCGTIIGRLDAIQSIQISIQLIGLIIISLGLYTMIYPILDMVVNKDKNILKELIYDLEYIKIISFNKTK